MIYAKIRYSYDILIFIDKVWYKVIFMKRSMFPSQLDTLSINSIKIQNQNLTISVFLMLHAFFYRGNILRSHSWSCNYLLNEVYPVEGTKCLVCSLPCACFIIQFHGHIALILYNLLCSIKIDRFRCNIFILSFSNIMFHVNKLYLKK